LAPLLEVRDLSISYCSLSETVRALRGVSLQIEEGETLGLIGETGSGKSTFAQSILGLSDGTTAVSGEIVFDGRALHSLTRREWKGIRGSEIGIVFQDSRSALNPVLTVEEHLVETLRAHQPLSKRSARSRALELLREVGVGESQATLHSFELSGGTCQRIGIALAICNGPRLLIADEPTSAIDSANEALILDLLKSLKQRFRLALLLISHDLRLIARIADRISVMYHGRIVESGLRDEVMDLPAHPYTRGLIECEISMQHHHELHPVSQIPGSIPGAGREFSGCAFSPRCTFSRPDCMKSIPVSRRLSSTHVVACVAACRQRIERAEGPVP
jgi:peptide/nickel transport system ATP-binding protein